MPSAVNRPFQELKSSRRLASSTSLRASQEKVYGIFPRLAGRRAQLAGSLSGGEQQMLAIGGAWAIMTTPMKTPRNRPNVCWPARDGNWRQSYWISTRRWFGRIRTNAWKSGPRKCPFDLPLQWRLIHRMEM